MNIEKLPISMIDDAILTMTNKQTLKVYEIALAFFYKGAENGALLAIQ